MTDRDGELVQHYGYLPFGNERYQNNTQAFSVTNRYTGQQLDEDTGLYFYGSRYYDPELARFIQPDSIVPGYNTSQILNRYTYCNNNPLVFVDPSGHVFDPVTLGMIVGAIIGGASAAAQGGNIWLGALAGAISGAFGGFGWANFADNLVGFALCNAAGGALGALVTGGDPGMAAVTAAISSTVSLGLFNEGGVFGSSSGSPTEQYLKQLTTSTGVGALMGGISAEIFGGSFAEGAIWGAASAAASYVLTRILVSHLPEMKCDVIDPKDVDVDKFIMKMCEELAEARYQASIKEMNDFARRFLNELWHRYGDKRNEYCSFAVRDKNGYKIKIRHPIYKDLRAFEGEFDHIPRRLFEDRKPQNAVMTFHTHGRGKFWPYRPERFSGKIGGNRYDIGVAEHYRLHSYLVTPKGQKWHYDYRYDRINDLGKVKK